jgi:hypothetical protein
LEPVLVLLLSFWEGMKKFRRGDQRLADGGQEDLFLKAFEPVIANVFTDDGAVFLFDSDRRSASRCCSSCDSGCG